MERRERRERFPTDGSPEPVLEVRSEHDGKDDREAGRGRRGDRRRAARQGRNPRTGDTVFVDEKYVPFFKTGKELRERLNRNHGG